MDDAARAGEGGVEGRGIAEVPLHQPRAAVNGRAMALGKIVQHGHVVAGLDQLADGVAADVARPPGHEDLHRRPIPS